MVTRIELLVKSFVDYPNYGNSTPTTFWEGFFITIGNQSLFSQKII